MHMMSRYFEWFSQVKEVKNKFNVINELIVSIVWSRILKKTNVSIIFKDFDQLSQVFFHFTGLPMYPKWFSSEILRHPNLSALRGTCSDKWRRGTGTVVQGLWQPGLHATQVSQWRECPANRGDEGRPRSSSYVDLARCCPLVLKQRVNHWVIHIIFPVQCVKLRKEVSSVCLLFLYPG